MKEKSNKKMLVLSAIGIIIVVLGHTGNKIELVSTLFPYYSFHMALFIFISGYFYKPENENKIFGKDGYLLKKIKKLIIPYFIWNLVYGLILTVFRHFDIVSFGQPINFTTMFIEPWKTGHQYILNTASWFLLALFLVNITYIFLRKIMRKCKIWNDSVMLILFFALTYFCAYIGSNKTGTSIIPVIRTGFLLFFYHFGYYYKTKFEEKYKGNNLIYFSILVFIQIVLFKIDTGLRYEVVFMKFYTDKLIVPILATITGILFWTKIAEIFEPVLSTSKIVNYIGNNTYDIMMHHLFWVFLINTVIYFSSSVLNLDGFNVTKYKTTIYYSYMPGISATDIIYTFVAIAGPLTVRYLYEKGKEKFINKNKKKNSGKYIKVIEKHSIDSVDISI